MCHTRKFNCTGKKHLLLYFCQSRQLVINEKEGSKLSQERAISQSLQGVTDIILDNNLLSPLGSQDSFIVTLGGKWVTIVLQGSWGGKNSKGKFLFAEYMRSSSQMKNYEPKWQPLKREGTSLEKSWEKIGLKKGIHPQKIQGRDWMGRGHQHRPGRSQERD